MNSDPAINCIVFESQQGDNLIRSVGQANTKDPNCVRTVWQQIQKEVVIREDLVCRIYSDWEPAQEDKDFIKTTFRNAQLTFSFKRPKEGQWDEAMKSAEKQLQQAEKQSTPAQRKIQRLAALIFLFGVSAWLIWLGNSWLLHGVLPVKYIGYFIGFFGLLGICRVNIWAGGPLDPRMDIPPDVNRSK